MARRSDACNVFNKLMGREIGSKQHKFHQQKFRDFRLQEEYDPYDSKLLRYRSKVRMITSAQNIVFVLLEATGLCLAYGRENNKMLCVLNVKSYKYILSVIYHKSNDSIITISRCALDQSIECRSTNIRYIRSGTPDAGFPIFDSEPLKWPSFIDFDHDNEKALTFSPHDGIFKVFDLKNYRMLYSISDENIEGYHISPGRMLLIFAEAKGHLPLKILSIEDGVVLKSFNIRLHRNKELVFIEQWNEKLLIKQENRNLQIVNVFNSEITEIKSTELLSPPSITFLHRNQLFLTRTNHVVTAWDLQSGDLKVTPFEDHLLWNSDSKILVTEDEDLIISYCKEIEGNSSSIHISNILTGKSIAKIKEEECSCSNTNCNSSKRTSRIRSTVADALEGITAFSYDEDRHEIYTANKDGVVHVWSN